MKNFKITLNNTEIKSFEELEQLKQEGRIGWVEFLLQSEYGESYKLWLNDRGAEADEDNAELFLEQTDASFFDNQEFLM